MKPNLLIKLSIACLLLQSCNDKIPEESKKAKEENKPVTSVDTTKIKKQLKWDVSSIIRIDSTEFLEAKHKAHFENKTYTVISDFRTAKEMLKGIVSFGHYENSEWIENDTGESVIEIKPRNGKKVIKGEFETYFVAYYPELDILLCEGGHTIDVSYNLLTGETTEDTGNPELIVSSSDGTIRLNGHYDGQECYTTFIQQKQGDHFKKIIKLSEIFNNSMGEFSLCTIGDSFWQNNTTLYLEETDNYQGRTQISYYYCVKLMTKPD